MTKINHCVICDSQNISKFYQGIDRYFSQKDINFSFCKKCSLIFLNPRPDADEYAEMYQNIFQDKRRNLSNVEDSIKRLETKKSYQQKKENLKYFQPYLNKDSQCLEIGSGWGTLSKVVVDDIGCSIDLVEPSRLASQTAKDYYGFDVFNGDFDAYFEQIKGSKKYDFIFLFHVFEHILNPNDFLQKVKKIMHKNGRLLLAIPDIMNPDQPNEKFFHIEHNFYYSANTIKLILNKNGFQVDKIYSDNLDLKIVCYPDEDCSKNLYFNNDEIFHVKFILFFYNLKFKILRLFKKIIFVFCKKEKREKLSKFFSDFMRKLRVIKN